jgi:hypothetical protein
MVKPECAILELDVSMDNSLFTLENIESPRPRDKSAITLEKYIN